VAEDIFEEAVGSVGKLLPAVDERVPVAKSENERDFERTTGEYRKTLLISSWRYVETLNTVKQ
jgi:hypothetical protein